MVARVDPPRSRPPARDALTDPAARYPGLTPEERGYDLAPISATDGEPPPPLWVAPAELPAASRSTGFFGPAPTAPSDRTPPEGLFDVPGLLERLWLARALEANHERPWAAYAARTAAAPAPGPPATPPPGPSARPSAAPPPAPPTAAPVAPAAAVPAPAVSPPARSTPGFAPVRSPPAVPSSVPRPPTASPRPAAPPPAPVVRPRPSAPAPPSPARQAHAALWSSWICPQCYLTNDHAASACRGCRRPAPRA